MVKTRNQKKKDQEAKQAQDAQTAQTIQIDTTGQKSKQQETKQSDSSSSSQQESNTSYLQQDQLLIERIQNLIGQQIQVETPLAAFNDYLGIEARGNSDDQVAKANPAAEKFSTFDNQDLKKCQKNLQIHEVCNESCWKTKAQKKDKICRYDFPKDYQCQGRTYIKYELSKACKELQTFITVEPKRTLGNNRTNACSRLPLQLTRCNQDMKVILDAKLCYHYLLKYVTKQEEPSKILQELLEIASSSRTRSAASLAIQVVFKAMGKRDMSQQEVSSLIDNQELYLIDGNLAFLSLGDSVRFYNGKLDAMTAYQKYLMRGNENEFATFRVRTLDENTHSKIINKRVPELNFMEFFTAYSDAKMEDGIMKLQKRRPDKQKNLILITTPYFYLNKSKKFYHQYCEMNLRKFKPIQISADNLLDEFSNKATPTEEDWIRSWETFAREQKNTENFLLHQLLRQEEEYAIAKDNFKNSDVDTIHNRALLQSNESESGDENFHEDPLQFVYDEMDRKELGPKPANIVNIANLSTYQDENQNRWSVPVDEQEMEDNFNQIEEQIEDEDEFISNPSFQIFNLNDEQRAIYDMVADHYKNKKEREPLRIIIQGKAGTGKSYLIGCLRELLRKELKIGAFTAQAAVGVQGETLHRLFNLKIKLCTEPLGHQSFSRLKNKHDGVSYYILDEYSMIGCHTMACIEARLRQLFESDAMFGKASLILVGDLHQLPPVTDVPLYVSPSAECTPETTQGRLAFTYILNHGECFRLTTVQRDNESDPDSAAFKRIKEATITGIKPHKDDIKLLEAQKMNFQSTIQSMSQNADNDPMVLVPTRALMRQINYQKLSTLQKDVIEIECEQSEGLIGEARDIFGYTEKTLYLCKGAKIVINRNLNVQKGIYNAAVGTIYEIIFLNDKPTYLIIDLEKSNLRQDECFRGIQNRIALPMVEANPIESIHYRKQFPVNLAYAMTIHKMQGQTLDEVIVDFENHKQDYGLAIVALSRTRKLSDLHLRNMKVEDVFEISTAGMKTKRWQNRILKMIDNSIQHRQQRIISAGKKRTHQQAGLEETKTVSKRSRPTN